MTNPMNTPLLLLMAGLPGSGKSTVALGVGREMGWPVLDKDTVKSTLLMLGADEDLAAVASYRLLDELARDIVVEQGLSVIVDSPSSYEEAIDAAESITKEAGGVLQIVLCEASRSTRALRLATRERRISHVTTIDDEAELAIELRFERLPAGTIRLSTEGAPDDIVREIVSLLQATMPRA